MTKIVRTHARKHARKLWRLINRPDKLIGLTCPDKLLRSVTRLELFSGGSRLPYNIESDAVLMSEEWRHDKDSQNSLNWIIANTFKA